MWIYKERSRYTYYKTKDHPFKKDDLKSGIGNKSYFTIRIGNKSGLGIFSLFLIRIRNIFLIPKQENVLHWGYSQSELSSRNGTRADQSHGRLLAYKQNRIQQHCLVMECLRWQYSSLYSLIRLERPKFQGR